MLTAMLILVSVNVLVKDAVGRYPLVQLVFFRSLFSLIPCSFLVFKAGGLKALATRHPLRHLSSGLIGTLALICLFISLQLLPLAEAVTIHFSETFFLTILCSLFLKEHAGIHGWVSIIIGFIGVLIIVKPTGTVTQLGILSGILFAFGDAFYMMNARILTRTDHSAAIVIYFAVIASLITGSLLPWVWISPPPADFAMLALLGVGGGAGLLCLTQAYKYAAAATVAPMIYSALLWSLLFGYIFWGETPDNTLFFGASLVVMSGLYIIYQENRKHTAIAATAPQGVVENN